MSRPFKLVIVRRVLSGIGSHFPARASEWALSAMLLLWGIIVISNEDLFQQTRAFDNLAVMAPQALWGHACWLVGLVRLLALIVNGTFAGTWYSRLSPHVRSILAASSCAFWFAISLSVFIAPTVNTGIAIYPVLFALDFFNVARSAFDAKHSDEVARGRRAN